MLLGGRLLWPLRGDAPDWCHDPLCAKNQYFKYFSKFCQQMSNNIKCVQLFGKIEKWGILQLNVYWIIPQSTMCVLKREEKVSHFVYAIWVNILNHVWFGGRRDICEFLGVAPGHFDGSGCTFALSYLCNLRSVWVVTHPDRPICWGARGPWVTPPPNYVAKGHTPTLGTCSSLTTTDTTLLSVLSCSPAIS